MSETNYNVERILQLVRASFNEQMGDLSYQVFLQRLWRKLEVLNDPGVIKPLPNQGTRIDHTCTIKPPSIYKRLPLRDSSIF